MTKSHLRRGASVALVLLLSACSGLGWQDLFVSYSRTMAAPRQHLLTGEWDAARAAIPDTQPGDNNYLLHRLEQGRIDFLAGRWSASRQAFAEADAWLEWEAGQAQLRLGQGLQQAGSLLSNDQTLTYAPPDYEQILLHHYQALNYLFLGQPEGALVEARKANQIQERALAERDADLLRLREEVEQQGISQELELAESGYPEMRRLIGQSKGRFQSAYTFYLSAALYEAQGDLDDAYLDYQRAFEMAPESPVLQADLLRLARRLGQRDDLAAYQQPFASTPNDELTASLATKRATEPMPAGSGHPVTGQTMAQAPAPPAQLLILYEESLIPAQQEFFLPLPISTGEGYLRTFNVAFPYYVDQPETGIDLQVSVGRLSGRSSTLMQLDALAARSLQERVPGLLGRQILRLLAKEQLRRRAAQLDQHQIGSLVVGLYNAFSERADTRSWLSLPNRAGIWRAELPAGRHPLRLQAGGASARMALTLEPGKTTLVWVQRLGERLLTHSQVMS